EETVFFNQRGDSYTRHRQLLDPNHARNKSDADRVGQGDVRRKGHGHLNGRAFRESPVEIKEHASRADVLSLSGEFASTEVRYSDRSGQTHIETTHQTPFLRGLCNVAYSSQEHQIDLAAYREFGYCSWALSY